MKKIILFLVMSLAFTVSGNAQQKRVTILESKFGLLSPMYGKTIDLDTNTTNYYLYIGFQNQKYSSITDLKSVFITKDADLKALIKDLKTALIEMETKQNIEWTKDKYKLALYDFSNKLYFSESPKKGSGYTTISKKEVENLILWLESFQFGKE
jgi:hypothetical protein